MTIKRNESGGEKKSINGDLQISNLCDRTKEETLEEN